MKIELIQNPSKDKIEYISNSLFEFNCNKVGLNDLSDIFIQLSNDKDQVCGGIVGWSRWDWAHVENLWIMEEYRGQGLGKDMLKMFENIANNRNCKFIDLDTFNFQAPDFYKKLGYQEVFVIDGIGNNVKKHFLKKMLIVSHD